MLDDVLDYAARGWHLVPIRNGKHAGSVLGRDWQLKSSRDPKVLKRWFSRPCGVAVHLGPISGIIDVETDTEDGIRAWERELGEIVTPVFRSKRSLHGIFRHVPPLLNVGKTKVDVDEFECRIGRNRPDGKPMGCISVFPPGENRRWIRRPDECEPADPPDWLVQRLLDDKPERVRQDGPITLPTWVTPEDIVDAAHAHLLTCEPAIQGAGGDRQTFMVAWTLVSGYGLNFDQAMRLMLIYNRRCRPPWRRSALEHKVGKALEYRTEKYWAALRDFSDEIHLVRDVSGPVIGLDLYRREMIRVRAHVGPGVFIDNTITGGGKSKADILTSIKKTKQHEPGARISLTVIPDHANCRELVAEMKRHRLKAMAWPQMTEQTCRRYDEVEEVAPSGLPPAMVLCPKCPFMKDCRYQEEAKRAAGVPHLVITHRRFALQPEMAKGRSYIAVHEDARDMLGPMSILEPKDLTRTADALQRIWPLLSPWVAGANYTENVIDLAHDLGKRVARATETAVFTERPTPPVERPKGWVRAIWKLRNDAKVTLSGETVLALTTLLSGGFARWALMLSRSRAAQLRHLIVVESTWLPRGKTYVFSDATGQRDLIADLTGKPVAEITPAGRLRQRRKIIQIPVGLSRNSKDGTVERYLRQITARLSGEKLGLITFKPDVEKLFGEDSPLEPELRGRFAKVAYYGEGVDRASNDWTHKCDALIVLGTPYVPRYAIRAELIRRGLVDAATKAPPRRVDASWTGRDQVRGPVVVTTSVFEDPEWRSAEDTMVLASLEQAVGRARVYLEDGIDVVLVTDKLVDFDTVVCPQSRPNGLVLEMLRIIRSSPAGISVAAIAVELSVSVRHVQRLLRREVVANPNLRKSGRLWFWADPL